MWPGLDPDLFLRERQEDLGRGVGVERGLEGNLDFT
jgi:hypothetical protein